MIQKYNGIKRALIIQSILLGLSLLGNSGCQKNLKSHNNGSVASTDSQLDVKQQELNQSVVVTESVTSDAEKATQDISTLLDSLYNKDGTINLGVTQASTTYTKTVSDITGVINTALDKVLNLIQQVVDKIDLVEQKLKDEKAKLDPSNPTQQVAIEKIDQLLTRVDAIKGKINDLLVKVVERLDSFKAKLDQYKSQLSILNPAHLILLAVIEKIETNLNDFKQKISNIIHP